MIERSIVEVLRRCHFEMAEAVLHITLRFPWSMSSIRRRQIRHHGVFGLSAARAVPTATTAVLLRLSLQSGQDFSAWVGLVPKQNSSGGKDKLGSISKQGDRYLRGPFTAGAPAVIRYAKIHGTPHRSVEKRYESQFSTISKTRPC
jgi:hypothetical protein